MLLAHAGIEGPAFEILAVAAGLFVLGVVFLVQKTAPLWVAIALIAAAVLAAAGTVALEGRGGARPDHHGAPSAT